ncbi:diguanylate cyclase [uncultured Thiodictyon sp.]|uniref:diguanylate cyclase n=1 Tax=uncultured Thiodictyon sp. TaxID=1846217 RepID=UPI0025D59919|nr:diguanylate cyclase [uncultured Thiodictyon sp.]
MPSITRYLGRYLVLLSLLVVAGVGLSYWRSLSAVTAHNEQLAREMGRSFFKELLITRRWNAKQGGVYVPITDELQPNPYLKDPQRDVTTTAGVRLTKVNPAFMTRLLSAMTEQSDGVRFHMTSLKPINPTNAAADDWEREALMRFEAGATEQVGLFTETTGSVFRFMGRLNVEQACLKCHEQQGYKEGDVRGGIRVSLPWAPFQKTLDATWRELTLLYGAALAGLLTLLWGGGLVVLRTAREVETLNQHMKTLNERLEVSALTDSLTGVPNRLYFDRMLDTSIAQAQRYGEALSLIMLDLDHFKQVNDTHGHGVGDQVLQDFTRVAQRQLRAPDVLARWGGEEFVVAAPRTDLDSALRLAERLRAAVEAHAFPVIGTLTVSLGIAEYRSDDTALTLLERADAALYQAKALGRNRVAAAERG